MNENEELSSWLESRRLIISKLSSLETDIRECTTKIDRVFDVMRDRNAEVSEKVSAQLTELKIGMATVDVKIKIWSAACGCVAGGIAAEVMQLFMHH